MDLGWIKPMSRLPRQPLPMHRKFAFLFVAILLSVAPVRAQLLLSPGGSYTYDFSGLQDFGDGYSSVNPRGFATFYIDPARSTAGATYRLELFENNTGESPI